MANITSVNGEITLKGTSKSIESFLGFKELMGKWYYRIKISTNEEQLKELADNDEEEMTITMNFEASGRWDFRNTIEYLMMNIARDRKTEDNWHIDWTVEDEINYQQLNNEPITIGLEYWEIELGDEVLTEANYIISWKPGKIEEQDTEKIYRNLLELNAENVHDLENNYEIFDYSDHTAHDVGDNADFYEVELADLIEHYVSASLNVSDIGDYKTLKHTRFIDGLSEKLEEYAKENGNQVFEDIYEWIESEPVSNIIIELLK